MAAPPNFDAGALLEQLNRQNIGTPNNQLLPADAQPHEVLTEFEFRELPERLVPVAVAFLQPYVGKEVRINSLLMSLYAHIQMRNPRDNYIFTAKKNAKGYVFIAQKVVFEGVTIEANATRLSDGFLAGLMGYALQPESPLDYGQIERNATVVNELPGIVSQFKMKPGRLPGSSNVHLSADQGASFAGSATEENSGTRTLGEWVSRADVATYNPFGLADIFRINAQLSLHSQSVGLDVSAIAHPSGLRAGIGLSTFQYSYDSNTEGTVSGNPQQVFSRYKGVANSSSLNLTYPHVRTDEARQNLTVDLNYNTSVSDVAIEQQTTILGSNPLQISSSNAAYRLSDLLVRKVTFGVNGARALDTGSTINYQLAGVLGLARQRLVSAATQDESGEHTLGEFVKATAAIQLNQVFAFNGVGYEGQVAGEVQITHRNLVGPEKSYLGGIYRMQAWEPQALGGPQVVYIKSQVARSVPGVPGMAVGAFVELAAIQLSHRNYITSVGSQTFDIGTGWQTLADFGLMVNHSPHSKVSLSAALAKKLTNDPTVNGSRLEDKDTIRAWVSARITF